MRDKEERLREIIHTLRVVPTPTNYILAIKLAFNSLSSPTHTWDAAFGRSAEHYGVVLLHLPALTT